MSQQADASQSREVEVELESDGRESRVKKARSIPGECP